MRQSASTTISGRMSPPAIAPSGAPLCLMENTSPRIRGGVTLPSTSLPEGVFGPYPAPMSTALNAIHQGLAVRVSSSAVAESTSAIWLVRIGPSRWMTPPEAAEVNIAAPKMNEV